MLHWSWDSHSDTLAECLDIFFFFFFCWVCWVCKQELGKLLFCNISKPCNWLLALKQEKYPSDSCLSCLWQQHYSSVPCFAPRRFQTSLVVICLLRRNCLFTYGEYGHRNENGLCTSSWRQGKSHKIVPAFYKLVPFKFQSALPIQHLRAEQIGWCVYSYREG